MKGTTPVQVVIVPADGDQIITHGGDQGPRGLTGPVGPQGPAGVNGRDGVNGTNGTNGRDGKDGVATTYITQFTAARIWQVSHNLSRFPSVTTVDSSGAQVTGDVLYLTPNALQVTFSTEIAGTVYLN